MHMLKTTNRQRQTELNSLDILIMFETLCCRGPLEKLLKSGVDNLERLYKKVFTVNFGTMY